MPFTAALTSARKTPSLSGTRRDAINDEAVLRLMRQSLHDALRDAVAVCYTHARELEGLDPDEVMESINKYFSPTSGYQTDNFDEAFHAFDAKLEGVTGHWPPMAAE